MTTEQRIAGRELDAEIAAAFFGMTCDHEIVFVPREEVVAQNRREFAEEYKQEAPPGWEGDTGEWTDREPKWCEKCHKPMSGRTGPQRIARYSTDLASAWEVVGKLARPVEMTFDEEGDWCVCFDGGQWGCAKTNPLAICLAALTTLEPR